MSNTSFENRLREGSYKIIPPLDRYKPYKGYAQKIAEDAVPTVKEVVAWDMNDLRRMSDNELEILVTDLAREHHIYAALHGSHPNFDTDGSWTWWDAWMGYTTHGDEHELLVHKVYAMMVSIVMPDIFHRLK